MTAELDAVLDKVWCAAVDATRSTDFADDQARERYRLAVFEQCRQDLQAASMLMAEGWTTEWSPRYADDGSSAFASTFTEAGARQRASEASYLALFTRRCEPWARVTT